MLKCSKCNNTDPLLFSKDKRSSNGYSKHCKQCQSKKAKNWYQNNKTRQYNLARQPNMRFNYGIKNAKKRNLEWSIDRQSYYSLIKQPCYYCNILSNNATTGVWLDRINNEIGYILTNVVPCCGPCNTGRNVNFTSKEWKIAITAILEYRKASS